MLIELRSRDRRALVAGALILGIIGLWRFVVVPGAAELAELRVEVSGERELVARERALLRSASANEKRSEALVGALVTFAPRIFPADELPQVYLNRIADDMNVVLRRVERISEADGPGAGAPATGRPSMVRRLELRITAESDLEGVLSFLAALQMDERLLVAERIDLSLQRPVEAAAPEVLDAQLLVRAFTSGSHGTEAEAP